MKSQCFDKQSEVMSYEKSNQTRDSHLVNCSRILTRSSFPLDVSLRLVRNLSELSGIQERFQTSWNDKYELGFRIDPRQSEDKSQDDVSVTRLSSALMFNYYQ